MRAAESFLDLRSQTASPAEASLHSRWQTGRPQVHNENNPPETLLLLWNRIQAYVNRKHTPHKLKQTYVFKMVDLLNTFTFSYSLNAIGMTENFKEKE